MSGQDVIRRAVNARRRVRGSVTIPPPPPPPPPAGAEAPTWIDASTITFPDAPRTITAGGTYTGLRISAADGVNCVEINTSDIVIFRECIFEHSDGDGIYAPGGTVSGYVSNPKVEVYDSYFLGRHPTTAGADIGKAIRSSGGSRLIVENCQTQRGRIYAYQFSAASDAVLRVRYNVGLNIDGRDSAAGGEPTNTITGYRQFFQHNGRTGIAGTFEVAWNEIWNDPEDSGMEDTINLFASGGVSGNPLWVHHNLVNGAYPADPAKTNYAGGGFMLSDGGGTIEYVTAENNVVLASANYGIGAIAGGYITIRNNRIFRTGKWPDGVTNGENGDGPAIYLYNYSSSANWGNHTVTGNVYRWQEGSDPSVTNNTWFPSPGPNFTNSGNTSYGTVIDQAFIDAEVVAYRNGAVAANITIGVRAEGDPNPSPLQGVGSVSTSLVDFPKIAPTTTGNKYVDASVSASGDGNSLGTAYKTLSEGLAALQSGYTLLVKGAVYTITSQIYRNTNWASLTRVMAYGTDRPVIVANVSADTGAIRFESSSRRELWHGFHVRDVPYNNGGNNGQAIAVAGGQFLTLSDMWVSHCRQDGIWLYAAADCQVLDSRVWRLGDGETVGDTNSADCYAATGNSTRIDFVRCFAGNAGDDGFDFWTCTDGQFVDCVSYKAGEYWTGVNAGDGNGFKMGGNAGGGNNTVRGSLALMCKQHGFDDNDSSIGGNQFLRNTAYANGSYGIQLGSLTNTTARDNIALANTGSTDGWPSPDWREWADPGPSDLYNSWNLSITDALFADVSARDLSLLAGSPAIGAGEFGGNLGASDVSLEIAFDWCNRDLT